MCIQYIVLLCALLSVQCKVYDVWFGANDDEAYRTNRLVGIFGSIQMSETLEQSYSKWHRKWSAPDFYPLIITSFREFYSFFHLN